MTNTSPRPHVAVFYHLGADQRPGVILAFGPDDGQSIIMEHEEARYLLHKVMETLLTWGPSVPPSRKIAP